MQGFRQRLYEVMGGVHGCTHLTELIAFLPTAALQTFAGLRREIEPHEERPYQLDRCHALEHTTRHGAPLLPQVVPGRGVTGVDPLSKGDARAAR